MAQALCSGTGSAEVPGLDQSYLERFVGLPIRQGKRDVDVFRFPARRDRVAVQQMEIASKRAHNEQLCAYRRRHRFDVRQDAGVNGKLTPLGKVEQGIAHRPSVLFRCIEHRRLQVDRRRPVRPEQCSRDLPCARLHPRTAF